MPQKLYKDEDPIQFRSIVPRKYRTMLRIYAAKHEMEINHALIRAITLLIEEGAQEENES